MPRDWQQLLRRLLGHTAVQNALFLYGAQASNYIFPLITLSYSSRILGPNKLGLLQWATSLIWYFMTLTDWGFNLTATRRIAIDKDSPEKVSKTFSAVMMAKGLLTGIGFALMMIIVLAVPKMRADWLLFAISFGTVVGTWLFPMWLYQGVEKMGQASLRDLVAKSVGMVLIFAFVHHEQDYLRMAALQAGATMLAGAISLALAPRVCGVKFSWQPWSEVRGVLADGWPVFLSTAAITLSTNTNTVILGFVAPLKEVAYYSNAYRIVVSLRMLVAPMATALYPHISHMASKNKEAAVAFLRKYSLLLASPFFAMSLVLFVATGPIVHLVFGHKYDESIPLMRIMAFGPMMQALSHSYSTYYMLAFGYQKQYSRIILVATGLNFVLMACLLLTIRPSVAMAIIVMALDVFTVSLYYRFYATHSGKERAETPQTLPVPVPTTANKQAAVNKLAAPVNRTTTKKALKKAAKKAAKKALKKKRMAAVANPSNA